MSTNYNAGLDSSDVIVRYQEEATWSTDPAGTFTELRLTGESLSEQKTRTRPEEIKADGFVAHALTTQVQASGGINFALSYGTYDDLLEGLLNADTGAGFADTELAIQSVATTGIITTETTLPNLTGIGFTTNSASLFDSVVPGMWIRVSGYTAGAAVNNGLYRVTAVDTVNDEIQVSATAGNGPNLTDGQSSSGSEVNIQGAVIRNGTQFRSYFIEKQLAAALFLKYAGSYISDGNLSAQVGGYLEGAFNFLCASELNATSTSAAGNNAAPTGRVIDTVAGFQQLEVNDTAISAVVQGISWNVTKNNARAQYGLGNDAAQGMARGTIDVSGTMSVYFTDFTLYQLYKNETDQLVSFAALDNTGAGYIFTLPGVTLMNPQIVAGGPDTDIVSEFELEGNEGSGVYAGVIMQIDKIPAPI